MSDVLHATARDRCLRHVRLTCHSDGTAPYLGRELVQARGPADMKVKHLREEFD
jgi:hypothetical protein